MAKSTKPQDLTRLHTAALFRTIRAVQDLHRALTIGTTDWQTALRHFDDALTCAILLGAYDAHPEPELTEQILLVQLYECGYVAARQEPRIVGSDDDALWHDIGLFDCRETCALEPTDAARAVWLAGFRVGQELAADETA